MKTKLLLPLAIALAIPALPVHANPGDAQDEMRRDVRVGKVKKPSEVESAVLPTMPGAQYLGPEYDPIAQAYRLKFIRNGKVIFVDVDARTGKVIRTLQ